MRATLTHIHTQTSAEGHLLLPFINEVMTKKAWENNGMTPIKATTWTLSVFP